MSSKDTQNVMTFIDNHDSHAHGSSGEQHWYDDGNARRLAVMMVLIFVFFLVELSVGITTGSLALVTDAFHMFSDVVAMGIGLFAVIIAKRKRTLRYSFGLVRMEVIGGLINGVFLLSVCLFIIFEAATRFYKITAVTNPVDLMIVGGVGLFINLLGLVLLENGHGHSHSHGHTHEAHGSSHGTESSHGHTDSHGASAAQSDIVSKKGSLNMRAVYLHVLGDALGSISVIVVGAFITFAKHVSWRDYADPFISVIIACIIMRSAWPLVKQSVDVLLQSVPNQLKLNGVQKKIEELEGVLNLHELHVWELVNGKVIASAHVLLRPCYSYEEAMKQIKEILHSYNVHVTTLQLEWGATPTNEPLHHRHSADHFHHDHDHSHHHDHDDQRNHDNGVHHHHHDEDEHSHEHTGHETSSHPVSPTPTDGSERLSLDGECKQLCQEDCDKAKCCESLHPLLEDEERKSLTRSLSLSTLTKKLRSSHSMQVIPHPSTDV